MCQFGLSHGDGKKWYLQGKNYAEDMLFQPVKEYIHHHRMELKEDLVPEMVVPDQLEISLNAVGAGFVGRPVLVAQ